MRVSICLARNLPVYPTHSQRCAHVACRRFNLIAPVLRSTRPDPSVDFAAFESFSMGASRVLAGEGNKIDEDFVRDFVGRQGRRAYYPGAIDSHIFARDTRCQYFLR